MPQLRLGPRPGVLVLRGNRPNYAEYGGWSRPPAYAWWFALLQSYQLAGDATPPRRRPHWLPSVLRRALTLQQGIIMGEHAGELCKLRFGWLNASGSGAAFQNRRRGLSRWVYIADTQ